MTIPADNNARHAALYCEQAKELFAECFENKTRAGIRKVECADAGVEFDAGYYSCAPLVAEAQEAAAKAAYFAAKAKAVYEAVEAAYSQLDGAVDEFPDWPDTDTGLTEIAKAVMDLYSAAVMARESATASAVEAALWAQCCAQLTD